MSGCGLFLSRCENYIGAKIILVLCCSTSVHIGHRWLLNKFITLSVSLHLPYMVKHKVLLDKPRSHSWMLLLVMGSWYRQMGNFKVYPTFNNRLLLLFENALKLNSEAL